MSRHHRPGARRRPTAHQVAAAVDNVGHAADFQNKLAAYLAGTGAMHPSAAGGYVIEDYVSEQIGDDANTQFTPPDLRGSRPDVYFELDPMKEDDYTALIDLTADSKSSVGHVLKKGGGSWINHYKYPSSPRSPIRRSNSGCCAARTESARAGLCASPG